MNYKWADNNNIGKSENTPENPRTIHTIWRKQNAEYIEASKPWARADHNKLQERRVYFENGRRCDL